ncbi:MAG: hypothetical protein II690_06445 [Ruminococcus sp.]|nr:hypothetical protein [Ruminococcus sp.]
MKRFAAAVSAAIMVSAMSGSFAVAGDDPQLKPELSLPRVVLSEDDVKENRNVKVSLELSGADKSYSSFEFWTQFDDRLAIPVDSKGLPKIKFGSGVENMQTAVAANSYYDHKKKKLVTVNGVRTIGAAYSDIGSSGTVFTVTLTLPEDAKAGDVFPLNIIPMNRETANNDFVSSIFMNSARDEAGQQMQNWLFSKGLNGGYIKITSDGTDDSMGDVTGDGRVSSSDIVAVLQYTANSEKYPIRPELLENGDVNGDGTINAQDAYIIQQYDAKVITSFSAK